MAREIRAVAPTGSTVAARIMSPAGLWWNGSAFEAYASANYASYLVTLTEQGSSGVFVADFPAAITTGGTYEYFAHLQSGASPAEGDQVVNTGKVDWTGTASISAAAGAMSGAEFRDYVLRRGFKRTDKDTELYEAVTDAIQIMRRDFAFDEAEAETTPTDAITSLGDFKLALESDMGLLLGIVLEDGANGTPLVKISKAKYDELYPFNNADPTARGYPRHFCVYAGQIYLGPIPDQTSYAYRLSYSQRGGTVTESTTGVPFTNLYRDVLADKVMEILLDGLGEHQEAAIYRDKYELGMITVRRRERLNAGETAFAMRPLD